MTVAQVGCGALSVEQYNEAVGLLNAMSATVLVYGNVMDAISAEMLSAKQRLLVGPALRDRPDVRKRLLKRPDWSTPTYEQALARTKR